MPVRRVSVDFGDGSTKYDTSNIDSAPYPNRRGFDANGVSLCNNSNFGQSKDACIDRPFTIEHVYQCLGPMTSICNSNGEPSSGTSCWIRPNTNAAYPSGACVFRPRVFVEDNWGYCTGRCPNGSSYLNRGEGDKCFDGTGLTGTNFQNECDPTNPNYNPWVNFQGRIVVSPP